MVRAWHNFGTVLRSRAQRMSANFEAAWPAPAANDDGRFQRMWRHDLTVTAAIFHSRHDEVWQLTLCPHGVAGGYRVPRQVSHRATLRSRRRRRIVRTSSRAGESR